MKMDLARPGGIQALGVAACQSHPSEPLSAKSGRLLDSPESVIS